VFEVVPPDTVIHPRTVMVHSRDATVADPTMV
jgi:hypothetical protein